MRELLALVVTPFGLWLAAAAWVDADTTAAGRIGGTAAGAVLIVSAILVAARHAHRAALTVLAILGVATVVLGAVLPAGLAVRLAAVLTGLVTLALAFAATQVPAPARVVAVNKRGGTLAEIKSIKIKDGKIAAPSVLLGSMPETVYVTPEQIWNLIGNVDATLLKALPKMILEGRRASRTSEHADNTLTGTLTTP